MWTQVAILLVRALAWLPLSCLRRVGWCMGMLVYGVARRRRKVALVNLALCFPEVPESQRRVWARASFVYYCQALLDRGWLWHAREHKVRQRLFLHGALQELQGDTPTILFCPHFYGLDAAGAAIALRVKRQYSSIYSAVANPYMNQWMHRGRTRFGDIAMLNRHEGIRAHLSGLKAGGALYLLPDMDLGPRDSIFVPFFGQTAATVPSLSRMAKLGRAKVVPVVARMTPAGYEIEIQPAWINFPTDDVVADTTRMNECLQTYIRSMPAQYYWVHKRFKTRPEGQDSYYA